METNNYCYMHKTTPTKLSCSSCGKNICTKCMINASIGYKCRDCSSKNITYLERTTTQQLIHGSLIGLIIGIGAGFIWNYLNNYGIFINLLVAYIVGLCVSRTISKSIGHKIGIKIQIIAGIITAISLICNPIIIATNLSSSVSIPTLFASLALYNLGNFINILAVIIAVWATIRHFKF